MPTVGADAVGAYAGIRRDGRKRHDVQVGWLVPESCKRSQTGLAGIVNSSVLVERFAHIMLAPR